MEDISLQKSYELDYNDRDKSAFTTSVFNEILDDKEDRKKAANKFDLSQESEQNSIEIDEEEFFHQKDNESASDEE